MMKERESHTMKKKHTKAYFQYVEIINTMDIEQTTWVEIQKLLDEILSSDDLTSSERVLLADAIDHRGFFK